MAILDLFRNVADGLQNGATGMSQSPLGQRVASSFSGLQAPEDPQAIDPRTGMPAGMVYDANMQGLRNMSSLFLAAGQSMSGADRAKILAQMGEATDPTAGLYKMAQARLMNQNVQDALSQREQKVKSIDNLRKADTSGLNDREKFVFSSYLDANDPAGATDFLAKIAENNAQGVPLSDGTQVTKGVAQSNINHWNKTYAADVAGADESLQIASEMLGMIDEGIIGGQMADYKIAAEKLSRVAGGQISPEALRTEKGRAAVMGLVINRMKDLGGNDSYEELKAMQSMFAGGTLEPETIRANMQRFIQNKVRSVSIAEEQKRRLSTNGQAEYGTSVKFDPAMVSPGMKPYWDRIQTQEQPTSSAAPAGSGSTPNKSFKKLWE